MNCFFNSNDFYINLTLVIAFKIQRDELSYLVPEEFVDIVLRVFVRTYNEVITRIFSLSSRVAINQKTLCIINKKNIELIKVSFGKFCKMYEINPNRG